MTLLATAARSMASLKPITMPLLASKASVSSSAVCQLVVSLAISVPRQWLLVNRYLDRYRGDGKGQAGMGQKMRNIRQLESIDHLGPARHDCRWTKCAARVMIHRYLILDLEGAEEA